MASILRSFLLSLSPALILIALYAAAARADTETQSPQTPRSPQSSFQELFVAVQEAQIFPDQKSFADAVPKTAPNLILEAFKAQHPASRAALEQFVAAYFTMPAPAVTARLRPTAVRRLAARRHWRRSQTPRRPLVCRPPTPAWSTRAGEPAPGWPRA